MFDKLAATFTSDVLNISLRPVLFDAPMNASTSW